MATLYFRGDNIDDPARPPGVLPTDFTNPQNWADSPTSNLSRGPVPSAGDTIEVGGATITGSGTVKSARFENPTNPDQSAGTCEFDGLSLTDQAGYVDTTGGVSLQDGASWTNAASLDTTGDIEVDATSALKDAGADTVEASGDIGVAGQYTAGGGLTLNGSVTASAGGSVSISGSVSGSGSLAVTGAGGTVTAGSADVDGLAAGAGGSLTVNGTASSHAVSVNGGGGLTVSSLVLRNAGTLTGASVTVSGSGSMLTDSGALSTSGTTSATIIVSAGGTFSYGGGSLALKGIELDLMGSGSTLGFAGPISIGSGGNGALGVTGGATYTAHGDVPLGAGADDDGNISAQGAGSVLTATGTIVAGVAGNAIIGSVSGGLVSAAGLVVSQDASAGSSQPRIGNQLLVSYAGQINVSGDVTLGDAGVASASLRNGGTVTVGGNTTLAYAATSFGEIFATGAGSRWNDAGTIAVGVAGQGLVSIGNGAEIDAASVVVGTGSTVRVQGTGSKLVVTGNLIQSDKNSVMVSEGGTISQGGDLTTAIGAGAASLAVDGTGSTDIVGGKTDFSSGKDGSFEFDLSDGALFDGKGAIEIGDQGSATVDVYGAGSMLEAESDLSLDAAGTGQLSLSSAASVSVKGDLRAGTAAGGMATFDLSDASKAVVDGLAVLGDAAGATVQVALFTAAELVVGHSFQIAQNGSVVVNGQGMLTHIEADQDIVLAGKGTGEIDLASGATLTDMGDLTAGTASGGKATLNLTGDGTKALIDGIATLGDAVGTTVQVLLFDTAQFVTGKSLVIAQNGSVIVDGEGMLTNIEADGDVMLAGAGTGEIDLKAGATLIGKGDFTAGTASGGKATVNLTGDATKATIDGLATFGDAAGATVQVLLFDAAQLITGKSLVIAQDGSVVVDGEGMLTHIEASSDVMLAGAGTGELDLKTGATLTAAKDFEAGTGAGTGTLKIDGANAMATIGGLADLALAAGSAVKVALTAGAVFSVVKALTVADQGTASLTDDGAGSSLKASDSVVIGKGASGTIAVTGGASFTAAKDVSLGTDSGGDGVLTADGKGTDVTAASLTAGMDGDATLMLSGGAGLTLTGAFTAATGAGSDVTGSVTGAGSMLQAASAELGGTATQVGGTATFDVVDGGAVHITGDVTIGQHATADVHGGGAALDADRLEVLGGGAGVAGGSLVIESGGTVSVAQSASLSAGGSIDATGGALAIAGAAASAGTVAIGASGLVVGDGTLSAAGVRVDGTIEATGGTLAVDASLSGDDGTVDAEDGATLDLSDGGGTAGTLDLGMGATLALGGNDVTVVHDFEDAGFGSGNTFDGRHDVTGAGQVIGKDAHLSVIGAGVAGGDSTSPVLTFTHTGNGTETASFTIENSGSGATIRGAVQTTSLSAGVSGISAGDFTLAAGEDSQIYTLTFDPAQGSLNGQAIRIVSNFDNVSPITLTLEASETAPPCFARGTMIRTDRGEVPVEALAVDDMLPTLDGALRPIRWIGRREVDLTSHPEAMPLRVRAGALGPGWPARDLYLSPDHAVFFEGVLIPVRCLADGHAVARGVFQRVTYFHVELPSHDVIFAEGLPVESFLDAGDKDGFGSLAARDAALLWEGAGYAPLVVTGPLLDRARRVLARKVPTKRRRPAMQPRPSEAV